MKTKEELREWFWNRYNECYRLGDYYIKGNYNLYYNKGYARKKKIQTLLGNELEEPKEELSDSKRLFYLDYKNGWLGCEYYEIWSFFQENYSDNYDVISQFIKGLLKEANKMMSLTPAKM